MEYHLGIESSAVQAILNSTIDFTSYVNQGNIDPNLLCNRTQLLTILSIPKSEFGDELAPADIASHAICTLSIAENYRFTNQILKQLAVRKIIHNVSRRAQRASGKLQSADRFSARETSEGQLAFTHHLDKFDMLYIINFLI